MRTDTEIKGYKVLRSQYRMVEMDKFISMIQLDKSDYTKWRADLFQNLSGEEISKPAMKNRGNKSFSIKKEYDFSKGAKGKFYAPENAFEIF